MCQECGCGLGGSGGGAAGGAGSGAGGLPGHSHAHAHEGGHAHGHAHGHDRGHEHAGGVRELKVQEALLARNQVEAERNRGFIRARGMLVLNLVSAPGSGKTALIARTAERLAGRLRVGAVVGDLETDNDARRLRAVGMPVVQIRTGTLCHLEASMVGRAMEAKELEGVEVMFVENVGNLVCPAAYDLGEHVRVVLMSVTEGEDKPLKYPPLFHSAQVALITKVDLADAVGFDRGAALASLMRVSHHARILEVSSRSGQGMDVWVRYLEKQREAVVR